MPVITIGLDIAKSVFRVHGEDARDARSHGDRATPWQRGILACRPVKSLPPAKAGVAVLAQAAKTARIAWALLASGEAYRKPSRVA